MTELLVLVLLSKTKIGGIMVSWLLSKLFPVEEPFYHIYRRRTKHIPVMSSSKARAYLLHSPKEVEIDNWFEFD